VLLTLPDVLRKAVMDTVRNTLCCCGDDDEIAAAVGGAVSDGDSGCCCEDICLRTGGFLPESEGSRLKSLSFSVLFRRGRSPLLQEAGR
jgi:hypothetical protein